MAIYRSAKLAHIWAGQLALLIVTLIAALVVRRADAADLCAGLYAQMQELVNQRSAEQAALSGSSCSGSSKAVCIQIIVSLNKEIAALQKQLDQNHCPPPSNPIPDTQNICCGWRVDRHVRTAADVTSDGKADVVAFGDDGVWTAASTGAGGLAQPVLALRNFGANQSWSVTKHVRVLADVNGDKRADIVGFGDSGVWLALAKPSGGYAAATLAVPNFGADQGWNSGRHVRTLADINGDGKADIVAFGDAGVWTAQSAGDGFTAPAFVLPAFGFNQGWRVGTHERLLGDVNGDGRADIVAFGDDGVWLALADGKGGFGPAKLVLGNFGVKQGWTAAKYVRVLADINGDGKADIVAFGDDGVWTALSTGNGFAAPTFVLANFGYNQGWRIREHLRLLADINHDGRADIVAFGDDGVWLALADGRGGFGPAKFVIQNFGVKQGWDPAKHVRLLADVDGDGKPDIVAFGDDGVWTALSTGTGFAEPAFVLADFGDGGQLDVVQSADGADDNGFPRNPLWRQTSPEVCNACPCGNSLTTPGGWNATPGCTIQPLRANTRAVCASHWFNSPGPALPGLMDWAPAEYEGTLEWGGHSNSVYDDDDYYFSITRPDAALETPGRTGVHFEFESDETVDNWDNTGTWWDDFHQNAVDNNDPTAHTYVDGKAAIVIGMVALDLAHDDHHAELHPAYAVFVRLPGATPTQEKIAFFVRNWGDEGFCGPDQVFIPQDTLRVRLRHPLGARFTLAQNVWVYGDDANQFNQQSWNYQRVSDGLLLTFSLRDAATKSGFVGDLTIDWGTPAATGRGPQIRPPPPELEIGDPALKAKYDRLDPAARALLYRQIKSLSVHVKPARKIGTAGGPVPVQSVGIARTGLRSVVKVTTAADPVRAAKSARQRAFVGAFFAARGIK